jgi:signal transduction histidine kinase
MSQQCAPTPVRSRSLQQLQLENLELQRYLAAQRAVIESLERRVGRSLESLGVHIAQLAVDCDQPDWDRHLGCVEGEVNALCSLVADTMLLQKLEAGKVAVCPEPIDLQPLLISVSRHLLDPMDGSNPRLVCHVEADLPPALGDQELTEAVLTDLLTRGLKYSDADSPVVLGVDRSTDRVHFTVTAQCFAPLGNRDFATEIVLCCRRVEVQGGEINCRSHLDGRQTVTVMLPVAV